MSTHSGSPKTSERILDDAFAGSIGENQPIDQGMPSHKDMSEHLSRWRRGCFCPWPQRVIPASCGAVEEPYAERRAVGAVRRERFWGSSRQHAPPEPAHRCHSRVLSDGLPQTRDKPLVRGENRKLGSHLTLLGRGASTTHLRCDDEVKHLRVPRLGCRGHVEEVSLERRPRRLFLHAFRPAA